METTPTVSIALDMDGVIFRTTLPKHDAMLTLFPLESRPALSPVVLSLGGVPRREKLAAVHFTCYGNRPTPAQLRNYLGDYEIALAGALAQPSLTPGIRQFLQGTRAKNFVCSSAPMAEVLAQIDRAGLTSHFALATGAPTTKVESLNRARHLSGTVPLVFFGDARADLDAAQAANVVFVAVIGEVDQFSGMGIPKIEDFSDQRAVQVAIQQALVSGVT